MFGSSRSCGTQIGSSLVAFDEVVKGAGGVCWSPSRYAS